MIRFTIPRLVSEVLTFFATYQPWHWDVRQKRFMAFVYQAHEVKELGATVIYLQLYSEPKTLVGRARLTLFPYPVEAKCDATFDVYTRIGDGWIDAFSEMERLLGKQFGAREMKTTPESPTLSQDIPNKVIIEFKGVQVQDIARWFDNYKTHLFPLPPEREGWDPHEAVLFRNSPNEYYDGVIHVYLASWQAALIPIAHGVRLEAWDTWDAPYHIPGGLPGLAAVTTQILDDLKRDYRDYIVPTKIESTVPVQNFSEKPVRQPTTPIEQPKGNQPNERKNLLNLRNSEIGRLGNLGKSASEVKKEIQADKRFEGGLVQVDMHIRHYERIIRDEKLKRGDIS